MKLLVIYLMATIISCLSACKTTTNQESELLSDSLNLNSIDSRIQALTCSSDWSAPEVQSYIHGYLTAVARFNKQNNLMLLKAGAKISMISPAQSPICGVNRSAAFKLAVEDLAKDRSKIYTETLETLRTTPGSILPPDRFIAHGFGDYETRYIASATTLKSAVYWSFGYYDSFLASMKFDYLLLPADKASVYKAYFRPIYTSEFHAVYFEAVNELAKKDRSDRLEILNFRTTKVAEKAIEAVKI